MRTTAAMSQWRTDNLVCPDRQDCLSSTLRIPDHRQKLILAQHRNAERLCFLQLRSGRLTGHYIRRFRRDRARRFAAFTLNEAMNLVAREFCQRAGNDDSLAGERRSRRGGDELRSNAEAFHFFDALA